MAAWDAFLLPLSAMMTAANVTEHPRATPSSTVAPSQAQAISVAPTGSLTVAILTRVGVELTRFSGRFVGFSHAASLAWCRSYSTGEL